MNDKVLAVQRMQNYINEHINENITLAELSKVSLYSPFHSHRMFKDLTGFTPADYIRRLKLSKSAMNLKINQGKILDEALNCGFESADGYTRAFHKEFGCTPKQYEKSPVPITLFIPYGVKFKELRKEVINLENLQNVFVQLINKPKRKVIIKRGIKAEDYFPYCEEVGCDIWGLLMSMDSICGEPVCLWLPEKYKMPNTSTYVQGVEVPIDYNGIVPDEFDIITLPEAEYLVFQGEPFNEEDYCEAISAVQESIKKYDPTIIGYVWDDTNPRIQLEPRGERGYIELKAVKHK